MAFTLQRTEQEDSGLPVLNEKSRYTQVKMTASGTLSRSRLYAVSSRQLTVPRDSTRRMLVPDTVCYPLSS